MSERKTKLNVEVDPTKAKAGTDAAVSAFAGMRAKARSDNKAIEKSFAAMFNFAAGGFGKLAIGSKTAFDKMQSFAIKATKFVGNAFLNLGSSIVSGIKGAINSAFGTIWNKAFDLVRAFGTELATAFSIRSIIQAGIDMQKFEATLSVATGTIAKARVEIEWLMDLTKRLGISFTGAIVPYAKLFASAKDILSGESVREIFSSFGKVSSALRLGKQEIFGVFLALQQIASKGIVSMEELRLQLAERVPGTMILAARSMGMSLVEFEKAVQQRLIPSSIFLKRFARELDRTFGPAAEKAMTMAQASVERFGIAIFALRQRLSNRGVLDAFARSLDRITAWMSESPEVFDRIGMFLGDVFNDLADALSNLTAEDVGKWLDNTRKKVEEFYNSAKRKITDFLNDTDGTIRDIGVKLGTALLEGLKSGFSDLWNSTKKWIKDKFSQLITDLTTFKFEFKPNFLAEIPDPTNQDRSLKDAGKSWADNMVSNLVGGVKEAAMIIGSKEFWAGTPYAEATNVMGMPINQYSIDDYKKGLEDPVQKTADILKEAAESVPKKIVITADPSATAIVQSGVLGENQKPLTKEDIYKNIAGEAPGDDSMIESELQRLSRNMYAARASYQAHLELQAESIYDLFERQREQRDIYLSAAEGLVTTEGKPIPEDMSIEQRLEERISAYTALLFNAKELEKTQKKIDRSERDVARFMLETDKMMFQSRQADPRRQLAAFESESGKAEALTNLELQYEFEKAAANRQFNEMVEKNKNREQAQEAHLQRMNAIEEKYQIDKMNILENHKSAEQKLWESSWEGRAQIVGGILGDMSDLLMQGSKEQFEIGKKLAIAQALIDTVASAQKAYNSLAGIPYVGPFLGAAAAATAMAAGMHRVNLIKATEFQGQMHDGGFVPKTGTYLLEGGEYVQKKEDARGMGKTPSVQVNVDARNSNGVDVSQLRMATEQAVVIAYNKMFEDVRRRGPIYQRLNR